MKDPIENQIKEKEAELIRLRNKARARKGGGAVESTQVQQESTIKPTSLKSDGSSKDKNSPAMSIASQKSRGRVHDLRDAMMLASGKKLLICIKGYPDPDNIASALALQWLCQSFDVFSTIVHFEEISHHENRALVKKLDIDIEHYTEDFDLSQYSYYAINDSQSTELPVKMPAGCQLLVFVDHHKTLGTVSAEFLDIREDAGATSSIYSEYLMDPSFKFSAEDQVSTKIATALMHGIRTDTDNFVTAQPIDYHASEFLARFVDRDLLALISRQSIPARTMDLTQIALQRKDIKGNFMFSGVGFVRDEDRDGIGQCADYLLHREGIETVVVYGVVNGAFIDGSLRTKSHVLDPDKWLKDVFGKDPKGNFYGGGRKDKGGFQIPLGVFAECSDKELLWIMIKKTIDELFYQKIGVEERHNGSLDSDRS